MDYSHIDISSYGWSNKVKEDYRQAMEFLAKKGFQEHFQGENRFSLDFEDCFIVVTIGVTSYIELEAHHLSASSAFVFGKADELLLRFKRIARAI